MQVINDFKTSVIKALEEIDPKWESYPGLIVAGSHSLTELQPLDQITEARLSGRPFLGICMGMQLAVMEYLRNVGGIPDATSQEFQPDSPNAVIVKMPEIRVGIRKISSWMGISFESHWHKYEVSAAANEMLLQDFLCYGSDDDVLSAIVHKNHPYFKAVQFHPEYQSSKDKPHRILKEFLEVCKNLK